MRTSWLQPSVVPSWSPSPSPLGNKASAGGTEWLGRCVDLAKAYKQMAVPRAQRHLVVLCHHNDRGLPVYYISESLPFGQRVPFTALFDCAGPFPF